MPDTPWPEADNMSLAEAERMEMRVMSVGCSDRDFRLLMDSWKEMAEVLFAVDASLRDGQVYGLVEERVEELAGRLRAIGGNT